MRLSPQARNAGAVQSSVTKTQPETSRLPSLPASAFPTLPHMSRSRAEGMAWYCSVMAQASSAEGDVERFLKGL